MERGGSGGAITCAGVTVMLASSRNDFDFQDETPAVATAKPSCSAAPGPNTSHNRTISQTLAKYAMCALSQLPMRLSSC